MAKFPEAEARKFKNVFVCRRCTGKQKSPVLKILAGKVSCRRCGYGGLRVKRKK